MSESFVAPRTRDRTSIILLVLAVVGISNAILQGAIAPAIPQLQRDLGTSINGATWILTAMLLSASISAPVVGKLGDLRGKKRVLIAVLLVFAFGTALSGFATSLPVMLVGRVLQGIGGGVLPLTFGIVRELLPRERVAGAIGFLSATLGIGGGFGIVASGLIVRYLDTRFLFWLPLGPVVLAIVALWFFLPASTARRPGSINWPGALLLASALTAFLLAISQGRSWGWTSPLILGLFAGAIVAAIAWLLVERRAAEPLISTGILMLRGVWTANLVALLVGVGMFGSFIVTSQLLQVPASTGFGFGYDVLTTGFFLLPSATMLLVTGLCIGYLERRFGARSLNIAGASIAMIGFALLALAHDEPWQILLANFVLGIGIGLCFATLTGVVVLAVPRDQVGAATGVNTIVRTIGSALGSAIPGSVLAGSIVAGFPTETAFVTVFWSMAGAMLLATAAASLIPRR